MSLVVVTELCECNSTKSGKHVYIIFIYTVHAVALLYYRYMYVYLLFVGFCMLFSAPEPEVQRRSSCVEPTTLWWTRWSAQCTTRSVW